MPAKTAKATARPKTVKRGRTGAHRPARKLRAAGAPRSRLTRRPAHQPLRNLVAGKRTHRRIHQPLPALLAAKRARRRTVAYRIPRPKRLRLTFRAAKALCGFPRRPRQTLAGWKIAAAILARAREREWKERAERRELARQWREAMRELRRYRFEAERAERTRLRRTAFPRPSPL